MTRLFKTLLIRPAHALHSLAEVYVGAFVKGAAPEKAAGGAYGGGPGSAGPANRLDR